MFHIILSYAILCSYIILVCSVAIQYSMYRICKLIFSILKVRFNNNTRYNTEQFSMHNFVNMKIEYLLALKCFHIKLFTLMSLIFLRTYLFML